MVKEWESSRDNGALKRSEATTQRKEKKKGVKKEYKNENT